MKNMSKQKRTTVIIAAVAVLCVLIALVCWFALKPDAQAGDKAITINVAHTDGTTASFPIATDAEYLYDAQEPEGILTGEEGQYGLFVTAVDGETADADAGEYWMYTVNGEMAQYGVDTQPIADGDVIEFYIDVYTP